LAELKEALEKEDIGHADRLLSELSVMRLGPEASELISRIAELVLTSDFQAAAKHIGEAVGGAGNPAP
jgi:hypothetical protein